MKFGIFEDDSSEDEYVHVEPIDDEEYSSDEYHTPPISRKQNISDLGRNIRAIFDDSDSDDGEVDKITTTIPTETPARSISITAQASSSRHKSKTDKKPLGWILVEPTVDQLLAESESEYDGWLKVTEAQAWRDGHQAADRRLQHLQLLASQARAEMRARQKSKAHGGEQITLDLDLELHKQFETLSIRQKKDDEDAAKQFTARENKIWDEVNEAIRLYENKMAEAQAAAAAEARRMREAEEARIVAEEKARKAAEAKMREEKALAAKAEKERREREAREKDERDRIEKEEKEKAARAEAEAMESRKTGKRGLLAMEIWKEWVGKQQVLKKEIIEVVKNERASLRQGMRLITRGVGQVVNTRESILRLTNEIHDIFSSQLPSPPTASSPTILFSSTSPLTLTLPPRYVYLLSHFSKAIIKQAEAEVNAKPEAAFPLARVILGLLVRGHAALGDVLFSRFVKKCPWVIPFYPSRQNDQPRDEYEKSTGMLSDESRTVYIDRMAGIVTVYFAILQTSLVSIVQSLPESCPTPNRDQLQVLINPQLRFTAAWQWLALMTSATRDGSSSTIASLPPAARLVSVFINVLGAEFLLQFREQGRKVLEMVQREGVEGGKLEGDTVADKQRLKLIMDEWKQTGKIEASKARQWE